MVGFEKRLGPEDAVVVAPNSELPVAAGCVDPKSADPDVFDVELSPEKGEA